jgi:hypothetical protein
MAMVATILTVVVAALRIQAAAVGMNSSNERHSDNGTEEARDQRHQEAPRILD